MQSIQSRTPLRSKNGFMYLPARLCHPADYDLKGEWFILFYTTDDHNQKLIRKRYYKGELSRINNVADRINSANEIIRELNYLLEDGYHLDVQPTKERKKKIQKDEQVLYEFRTYTLLQAIDYAANIKYDVEGVRKRTLREYKATKSTLEDFMSHAGINREFKLSSVNETFVRKYFDYLKQERKSANKTFNARRAIFQSAINALMRRDKKLFAGENPVSLIKKLKEETRKHAAYNDNQVLQIREAILEKDMPHLLFFIQFMYYSLARPEELRNLQVGNIDLQARKILFRAEVSKTNIEQYVGINETFAKIIVDSKIMESPSNYYVFSNAAGYPAPGHTRVAQNYYYKNIKPIIAGLGFYQLNPYYTLYSFKHTGAIALYRATRDIKLVQSQCRHQTLEQTNNYLRDLGAIDDFEQLNKWKGPL